jgi:hypothetical protein
MWIVAHQQSKIYASSPQTVSALPEAQRDLLIDTNGSCEMGTILLKALHILIMAVPPVVVYLKTEKLIPGTHFLVFLVTSAIYLVVREIVSGLPTPESASDVRDKQDAANTLLNSMLRDYYEILQRKTQIGMIYEARANVMLLTRSYYFLKYMQIKYEATQNAGVVYTGEERRLLWRKTNGAVGKVWKGKSVECLGSDHADWSKYNNSLRPDQLVAVSKVKSILSVPIFSTKDKSLVAILSIDSSRPPTESLFCDKDVKNLAVQYSNMLRPLCPPYGVKMG